MMPETLVIWLKISGATIGSSIAIVFKPGNDSKLKLLSRFVIGTILGVISAPVIIDTFSWTYRADYWLASSALGGLFGYLSLHMIFNRDLLFHLLKVKR